jgi:hypothetical protein
MIARDCHGRRLGELLRLGRLDAIIERSDARGVRLGTSQLTCRFFERYGFEIRSTEREGIDTGLDSVEMYLEMTDDRRRWLRKLWQRLAEEVRRPVLD